MDAEYFLVSDEHYEKITPLVSILPHVRFFQKIVFSLCCPINDIFSTEFLGSSAYFTLFPGRPHLRSHLPLACGTDQLQSSPSPGPLLETLFLRCLLHMLLGPHLHLFSLEETLP